MNLLTRFVMISGLAVVVGGCTVGPDYKAPEPVDGDFTADLQNKQAVYAQDYDPNELASWWGNFNDPALTDLINESLSGNYDIKIAQAKVKQTRAYLGISKADQLPTLDASGSYSHTKYSDSTRGGGQADIHSLGIDAGWELDIFGGTRRAVEAASAELQAQEYGLDDVWVSLAAEVAVSYVDLRTAQQQLAVAQDNLKTQGETLELLQSRQTSGLSDQLAVEQARYNMETTKAAIPAYVTAVEVSLNRLAVLTGKMPGELHEKLAIAGNIPAASDSLVFNIPADALRHRVDIRIAERALAAQTAKVGVATAQLYPSFTLSGSIGYEALSVSNMFDSGNSVYAAGPSFRWNIFNADRIKNNIKVQDAMTEVLLASYQQTILNAAGEVRNRLVSWQQQQERLKSIISAEVAADSALTLAQDKYKNGLADFNNVLDAQRSLLALQAQKVSCRGSISTELIGLYKAVGGGWK